MKDDSNNEGDYNLTSRDLPPVLSADLTTPPAEEGDGQACSLCGYDHFEAMRRALTQIYDYTGRDFQAIKNTAYKALPNTKCLAARAALAAVVHPQNEEGNKTK